MSTYVNYSYKYTYYCYFDGYLREFH